MQTTRPSLSIQLLPEHIIDQIKAGEVIEKPSTLLKEILENALDAGATQIDLHLGNNGLDFISLIDNGHGISPDDLPLAFCRHATSKIERFEDIYRLSSYGFRGEALASIASISKVTCETQTQNKMGVIKIEGGETLSHQVEDSPNLSTGTKLFIKDLFYNTPVRMKFIQSKTSEKNQLNKMIDSFLLLNPEVNFSIKWDQGEKIFYPAVSAEEQVIRFQKVLEKRGELDFLSNSNHYDGVQFKVFLSRESSRGNAHKSHFLFINDRFVQDIQLHKIILNSASDLWPEGETGHYVAMISVPNDEIDVNIHPNKTVVKLFKAPKVFSIVSSTIRQLIASEHRPNKTSLAPTEKTMSLPLNQTSADKEIHYRSFDFNDQSTANRYFEDLHRSTPVQESHLAVQDSQALLLHSYNDLSLFKLDQQLFLLNTTKLAQYHFKTILQSIKSETEIVPLMISRPIEINQDKQKQHLQFFTKYGFELDHIENKVLLRSFPKIIQHYPYLKFLEENLNQNKEINSLEDLSYDFLDSFEYSHEYLFSLIKEIGRIKLLELELLKKLEQKDLLKIYERK